MKQDIETSSLEENSLYIFTPLKVFLTFIDVNDTFFSNNTQNLKSSVQNGTGTCKPSLIISRFT